MLGYSILKLGFYHPNTFFFSLSCCRIRLLEKVTTLKVYRYPLHCKLGVFFLFLGLFKIRLLILHKLQETIFIRTSQRNIPQTVPQSSDIKVLLPPAGIAC
ncbi:unnamed protein product [Rangifer tarandus platyrhynchus]|uniref:Uncharacterized protein n=2 Tax=Rangifer tarandus platyrhynchus TaxID=3082113 RepID=A0ABN8YV76_RANTA|nr:unnamed protein product [Rangifer tarandus platyrhynchus]